MTRYAYDYRKVWLTVDAGTIIQNNSVLSDLEAAYQRIEAILYALKDRLTSDGYGAWVVLASSGKNGGGSLVADASDNWTSPEDLVWGSTSGSDRSWVLLQSPNGRAGTFYLLIDYYGSDRYKAYLTFTRSQPDISAPAINARPPATGDEWSHSDQQVGYGQESSANVTQFVLSRAIDGSFFGGVCTPKFDQSAEQCNHFFGTLFIFNVIRNTKSWDTARAASLVKYSGASTPFYSSSLDFQSLHSDGTQVNLAATWLQLTGSDPLPAYTGTNPWAGTYVTMPVFLVSKDVGKVCLRGELEDIYMLPQLLYDGAILFKNEVPQAMKVGPFSCPMFERSGII